MHQVQKPEAWGWLQGSSHAHLEMQVHCNVTSSFFLKLQSQV